MTGTTPVQAWPDLAGRLIGELGKRHHVLPVRVYFEDTDFSGIVYHATYLRWCERGRSDFLRLMGVRHEDLIAGKSIAGQVAREAAAFVVRRMGLEYLSPARIDDVLEVTTRVKELGAATLELDQTVSKDGKPLFKATVLVVLVSQSGKVMRLGPLLRQAFEA
jgi:acyl-CoA thioester hydrolase